MLNDEARYKHSTNLLAVGNAGVREVFRRLSNIYDKGLLRKSFENISIISYLSLLSSNRLVCKFLCKFNATWANVSKFVRKFSKGFVRLTWESSHCSIWICLIQISSCFHVGFYDCNDFHSTDSMIATFINIKTQWGYRALIQKNSLLVRFQGSVCLWK